MLNLEIKVVESTKHKGNLMRKVGDACYGNQNGILSHYRGVWYYIKEFGDHKNYSTFVIRSYETPLKEVLEVARCSGESGLVF